MRTIHTLLAVVLAAGCAQAPPALVVLDAKLRQTHALAFDNPDGAMQIVSAFPAPHGDIVVDIDRQTATDTSMDPLPTDHPISHTVVARVTRSGKIVWADVAHAAAGSPCSADLSHDDGALDADITCAKGDFGGAGEGRSHVDVATGALHPAPPDSCRLAPSVDVGDGTVIASLGSELVRTTLDGNGCMAFATWSTDITTTPVLDLDPSTMHIVGDRVLVVQQLDDTATFASFSLDSGALLETHDASSVRALPAADGWFSLDAPFNQSHAPRLQHLDARGHVIVDVAADGLRLLGVDSGLTSAFVADANGAPGAVAVDLPRE
jgi:hypothetical protein